MITITGPGARFPQSAPFLAACGLLLIFSMNISIAASLGDANEIEQRVQQLIEQMSIEEKVGQMNQVNGSDEYVPDHLRHELQSGRVGSILNVVNVEVVNEMQRIAVEESRLGIPLLIGRDVIHGFKTVMPIPLGQAATWNPDVVRAGAEVAATEAAAAGVNWTFAPMIDIARDARWGRIAESLGEDPHLATELGVAMVQGFQGDDLSSKFTIAACAKHFAGYGASESGRDYATTNIPENELRNVYLKPFNAAVEAGAVTLMASFGDLNGVPASGNKFLMDTVLRGEWAFDGFVVSDYNSIRQLAVHGFTESDKESAYEAAIAGVDMEMVGGAYGGHLAELVAEGRVPEEKIDTAVANILRAKFRLGLFENPYTDPSEYPQAASEIALNTARTAALQSVVMLKNENSALPIAADQIESVAVIGPLADAPYEQMGTWVFDGDPELSVTGLQGIRDLLGESADVRFVRAMQTSRSQESAEFDEAVAAAADADRVILFLGEEAILSGEAHSRANIDLPGAQEELVRRIAATGKPIVAVILAGRPLTLTNIVDQVDAILYAWHPGSMGGPAIADLLFGKASPSGKLPATFPRMVGQIPIYYNQKNTGKPPRHGEIVYIDDIDAHAPQTSLGMSAFHLDAGFEPLFPFGFGLSYGDFQYRDIRVSSSEVVAGDTMTISAELTNNGSMAGDEVVQLYVRDLVGNVTRPVRELKGFRRVHLEPGDSTTVEFALDTDDLAFFGRDNEMLLEAGDFHVWIGGVSTTELRGEFRLIDKP